MQINPVAIVISLGLGMIYYYLIYKQNPIKQYLLIYCLIAMINPLFHHEGLTTLFYLPSGNAFTLEALLYGLFQSAYFISIILWFMVFQKVCDSQKIIYLCSKVSHRLGLFLSMILRMIPYFQHEYQECLFVLNSKSKKLTNYFKAFSMMVSHALNYSVALETSMKSRGYGTSKYTHYHNYQLTLKDYVLIVISIVLFILCLSIQNSYYYYPIFLIKKKAYIQAIYFAVYSFILFVIELRRVCLWRFMKSNN